MVIMDAMTASARLAARVAEAGVALAAPRLAGGACMAFLVATASMGREAAAGFSNKAICDSWS